MSELIPRAAACALLALLVSVQPAAADEAEPSRHWGASLGLSAGSGNELTPADGQREISHDVLSGSVGLVMRTGRARASFSYQLGVEFWQGRLELEGGGEAPQSPEQPDDNSDGGSILDDILNPGGGGDPGGEPDDPTAAPALSDQDFKGVLTSHSLILRPDEGRLAFGLTLYAGRIYATSPDFGGDAGSYPLGIGATVLLDGQYAPESGMPSLEFTVREMRGMQLEQGGDEPTIRQAEAVLRAIWFFGR